MGPLATTISAIARRARVERETVYRHFPDERSLFAACTAHHLAAHPGPSIATWRAIIDPPARLERALHETYAYYAEIEPMAASILRDAEVAPHRIGSSFAAFHAAALTVLLEGWPPSARGRRGHARAAIGHALRFQTWRSLVRDEELGADGAIRLMVALVRAA